MKNFIPPFLRFKKFKGPQVFSLTCKACHFERTVELVDSQKKPLAAESDHWYEQVTSLPTHCPHCGKKLKSQRVPIYLRS